ncbi:hypothetical protein LZ31DRAFT_102633 [Colletotrichum somersetense]|nr:hypothetical protein LZ31DRAFT_102633 [Colletotrichum somersetense]
MRLFTFFSAHRLFPLVDRDATPILTDIHFRGEPMQLQPALQPTRRGRRHRCGLELDQSTHFGAYLRAEHLPRSSRQGRDRTPMRCAPSTMSDTDTPASTPVSEWFQIKRGASYCTYHVVLYIRVPHRYPPPHVMRRPSASKGSNEMGTALRMNRQLLLFFFSGHTSLYCRRKKASISRWLSLQFQTPTSPKLQSPRRRLWYAMPISVCRPPPIAQTDLGIGQTWLVNITGPVPRLAHPVVLICPLFPVPSQRKNNDENDKK